MSQRGRKDCPGCKAEIGARFHNCPECGHDFMEGREENNKDTSDLTQKILQKEAALKRDVAVRQDIICRTPDEHANRILSYGHERAQTLYNLHSWGSSWSHVNWKKVEEGLKLN